jgi:hypothetical protein
MYAECEARRSSCREGFELGFRPRKSKVTRADLGSAEPDEIRTNHLWRKHEMRSAGAKTGIPPEASSTRPEDRQFVIFPYCIDRLEACRA